jgi:glycosyltransferase involved in cell wall biosynthesis
VNVLIVNYEYPPVGGGAATASQAVADALARAGHRVAVLTSALGRVGSRTVEADVVVDRVAVGRTRADRSTTLQMARFVVAGRSRAARLAAELSVDGAIAFFSVPSGPIALSLRRRLGVPYVVSLRGGDVPGHVPALRLFHALVARPRRRVLREAAAVVANSASLAELARRADGVPVEVVANGVDATFFSPPDMPPALPFRFLFVGRLHAQKDPEFVVRGLAALRRRTTVPFVLDVVGDGPQADELRRLAETLGLADAVAWRGWLDRTALRDRCRASHCLVAASPREGMPNAVLEAMACGLPVIARRAPGYEEVVRDGATGRLFAGGDVDDLARCGESLLTDPTTRAEMGRRGREVVVAEHSWDRAAAAYVGFLRAAARR